MIRVEWVSVLEMSPERSQALETFMFSTSQAAERELRRGSGSTRLAVLHKQSCVAGAHFLLHDTDDLNERDAKPISVRAAGVWIVPFIQTVDPSDYLLLDIFPKPTGNPLTRIQSRCMKSSG